MMPAEFEPHERTVMCWPARTELYGELMGRAEAAHALVASTIAGFEPVTMIVAPGATERAASMCGDRVEVVELPIDDSWFRDSGPMYVIDDDGGAAEPADRASASAPGGDGARAQRAGALAPGRGERVALDWTFNSWGGKFLPFADDAAIARRYAEHVGHPVRSVPAVMEGGALNVDGEGTLVTTEQCLLHPNRNPDMTRADIEAVLTAELGASTTLWLPYGLALDDDTDGHVDNVAAFATPGTLVMQGCADPSEDDWLRCNVNVRCARGATDAAGRAIDVVEVPVLPFTEIGGERVSVPYVNFYVANGAVVVPMCGHDADEDMLAVIAAQFPGRETIGLDVGAVLAFGGGGIHCITQQVPALPTRRRNTSAPEPIRDDLRTPSP